MVSVDNAHFVRRKDLSLPAFLILESLVFVVYYIFTIFVNTGTYLLYLAGLPLLLAGIIFLDRGLTNSLTEAFYSVDFIVFVAVLSFWYLLYGLYGFGRNQVLISVYAPVLLEEVNFRYILIEYVGRRIGKERAILIQGVLFTLWYLYFELVYQGTYPNVILTVLFIFSMFAIGIVYGVIYYFRKNLYIPMALHLTLLSMVLPLSPWYVNLISYLMGPT